MSRMSNNLGRGYEYICLMVMENEISKVRNCIVKHNSSLIAAQKSWNTLDDIDKKMLEISAFSAVQTIFDLEPIILEPGEDELILLIQPDTKGRIGDVRDILIIREDIQWEIGLSMKHNHFAVKHSRLSANLDFGKKWFGIPCTDTYWSDINPIFSFLLEQKKLGIKWKELFDKENDVYIPLLKAFINEINRSCMIDNSVPTRMVKYLLGEFDFYKVISIDYKRMTRIQSFNLNGTLNKASKSKKASIFVPRVDVPDRIVSLDFKPNSTNTIEMYFNNGWQFNFRIHNASTKVEPSLKFDIQIIGMPATIISIDCCWH